MSIQSESSFIIILSSMVIIAVIITEIYAIGKNDAKEDDEESN